MNCVFMLSPYCHYHFEFRMIYYLQNYRYLKCSWYKSSTEIKQRQKYESSDICNTAVAVMLWYWQCQLGFNTYIETWADNKQSVTKDYYFQASIVFIRNNETTYRQSDVLVKQCVKLVDLLQWISSVSGYCQFLLTWFSKSVQKNILCTITCTE